MKKLLLGVSLLLSVGFSAPKAEAYVVGPYVYNYGVGAYYSSWGWYPLVGIGVLPYYGYSYYPYFDFVVRYATFGAISYSVSTGAVGWSWGSYSQESAVNGANSYCGQADCSAVVWVQGGCAAIATNETNTRLGWGYNGAKYSAQNHALRACRAGSHGEGGVCRVKAWVCSWN